LHFRNRHSEIKIGPFNKRLSDGFISLASVIFRVLAIFLPISFTTVEEDIVHNLIVQPSSAILIDGKSNVNKFRCTSDQYNGSDTLIFKTVNNKTVFVRGNVKLNASGFDCGMRAITKDFAETINVEKFPFITIEFISFEEVLHYKTTEERFLSKLKLTLASVSKTVELRCGAKKDAQGLIHLKGARNFTFSDFGLDPPEKMGGLIKVDEKLNVNFHLVLKRG
jgi:hypothetical protein